MLFFLDKIVQHCLHIVYRQASSISAIFRTRTDLTIFKRYTESRHGWNGTHGNGWTEYLVTRTAYNSPTLFRDLQMSLMRRERDAHVTHYSFTVMISYYTLSMERNSLSPISSVNLRKTRNKLQKKK